MAKSTRFSPGSQFFRALILAVSIIGISISALAQVPLVNASFESPPLPNAQTLNPMPSGLGWEIRGDVQLFNGFSTPWSTSNMQQHGRQWAFMRAGTAISQTLALQPGTYVVSLQAAQAGTATPAQIKVSLGSSSAALLTPAPTMGAMTFAGISVATAGNYNLTIEVPEPASGTGFSSGATLDDAIVGKQRKWGQALPIDLNLF